jgi:hypothetical protein
LAKRGLKKKALVVAPQQVRPQMGGPLWISIKSPDAHGATAAAVVVVYSLLLPFFLYFIHPSTHLGYKRLKQKDLNFGWTGGWTGFGIHPSTHPPGGQLSEPAPGFTENSAPPGV